ncbi:MAG: AAA family ATPase [Fibrobacter sp.]|nr:AAA family ATPase [Fibrobacter sp.]
MNLKELLKFLFPEYQIFTAAKNLPQGLRATPKVQSTSSVEKTVLKSESKSESVKSEPKGHEPEKGFATIFTRQDSKASAHAVKDNAKSFNFNPVPKELAKIWIGSEKDIQSLVTAFKRPFVSGYEEEKPKNSILLLGHLSRGKAYAIQCISKILCQQKILTSSSAEIIDLGRYASDSSGTLFLSDIYACLKSKADVIIFEQPEKAGAGELDILQQLLENGVCKLNKRYVSNNGMLMDATGVLHSNPISEISANGKFFVFISTLPKAKILSVLGNKITKLFGDVIELEPFSQKQLQDIAFTECRALIDKCSQMLHIEASFDDDVVNALAKIFSQDAGIKGLKKFVEEFLYKGLTEMLLQNAIATNTKIHLTSVENEFFVSLASGKKLNFADYSKDINASELADVKKELDNIIGLKKVKDYIRDLETNVKIQQIRTANGLPKADISMHMIFAGNPGTGKTTVARIVAKYLKAIGVLSSGHLREVTRADLVGQYLGQTAQKTNEVINSALGGVLFIDEAYSLCRDAGDPFGLEAIDAIVKGMEDNRENLVVILAGYELEMKDFLKTNSGLKSRFPNIVHFEDYSSKEMLDIAKVTVKSKGYKMDADCEKPLLRIFEASQVKGKNDGGNGRLVRNVVEAAILQQSKRVVKNPVNLDLLIPEDFGCFGPKDFDLESELSKVIGLDSVKQYIRSLQARLKLKEARKQAGLKTSDTQTMHMIFAGNPGTGKTMMARTVANVLYNMNVITTNKLVETDRSGLVAGYVGQTAIKTREVIESALNGVLFIDEAYALAQGGPNDFGREAIDTLVKMMDDNRDRLVVILAGYSSDMENFLNQNAGLHSRFANIIEFPDYSTDELMQIAGKFYGDQGYILDDGASECLRKNFESAKMNPQFGNGRYVRNIFEKSLNNQALRLSDSNDFSKTALTTITACDLEGV